MRKILMAVVAGSVFVSGQAAAQDISGEISLANIYIDETTNDRFSNKPIAEVTVLAEFGSGAYAEAYVLTGPEQPFNDEGSEYGFEIGVEREVSEGTILNLAAGRWANYQGGGFGAGDWFAAVRLTHGRFGVDLTALSGDSDTALMNVRYDLPVNERITVTPSVAYITASGALNPGITIRYQFSKSWGVDFMAVAPEREGGRREVFVGGRIAFGF